MYSHIRDIEKGEKGEQNALINKWKTTQEHQAEEGIYRKNDQ